MNKSRELEKNELLPRTAEDLIGHEGAESVLENGYRSDKLSQSWLIVGPKGIGKATLAYRFARFVLKDSKTSDESSRLTKADSGLFGDLPEDRQNGEENLTDGCGLYVSDSDPVFRRIAANSHADLLIIERASSDHSDQSAKTTISVDDIRNISAFLRLTSGEGGWRVVIIDTADDMNINAANALLKILEEPPGKSLIMLVSNNPGRLLPTIRSRCQTLRLKPLSSDNVAHLLRTFDPGLDEEKLDNLVALSHGSIGRALTLAEQGGLETRETLDSLLRCLPDIDAKALHSFGDTLARKENEPSFRIACELLVGVIAGTIKKISTGNGGNPNGLKANLTVSPATINHLATLATLERWLLVWENTTRLMDRVDRSNLDRKQCILNMFYDLEQACRN